MKNFKNWLHYTYADKQNSQLYIVVQPCTTLVILRENDFK
jgi:hypothetical protein